MFFLCTLPIGNDWETIYLGDWGTIELPPSMEIQSGIYKAIMDEYKDTYYIPPMKRVVFQQNGLNEGRNLDVYARVFIRTDSSNEKLPEIIPNDFTSEDIEYLSTMFMQEVQAMCSNSPYDYKMLQWGGLQITSLSEEYCLNYSYLRKVGDNSPTHSEFYVFWKGYKQYTLNIEYRVNDAKIWKNDLQRCVNSLVLNR